MTPKYGQCDYTVKFNDNGFSLQNEKTSTPFYYDVSTDKPKQFCGRLVEDIRAFVIAERKREEERLAAQKKEEEERLAAQRRAEEARRAEQRMVENIKKTIKGTYWANNDDPQLTIYVFFKDNYRLYWTTMIPTGTERGFEMPYSIEGNTIYVMGEKTLTIETNGTLRGCPGSIAAGKIFKKSNRRY